MEHLKEQNIIVEIKENDVIIILPCEIFFETDRQNSKLARGIFKHIKEIILKEKVN